MLYIKTHKQKYMGDMFQIQAPFGRFTLGSFDHHCCFLPSVKIIKQLGPWICQAKCGCLLRAHILPAIVWMSVFPQNSYVKTTFPM